MNIVTSICIDKGDGLKSKYPQISKKRDRRNIYWQCVTTFCLTSMKVNKKANHIIYTNDSEEIIINGYNVKEKLSKQGVQIIHLPFDKFDPKEYSSSFRNAFYKLEVIFELGKLNQPSVLLDSDCIWTKHNDELWELLKNENNVLLLDTYQRSETPFLRKPHNLSAVDMKVVYDTFKLTFPMNKNYPIWYGGEFIGTSPKLFKVIGRRLKETFDYCIAKYKKGEEIEFKNGKKVFDNDEFISSFVYNSLNNDYIIDTHNLFIRRIWTGSVYNNVKESDIDLAIWHLPASKTDGLEKLFKEITKEDSFFWKSPTNKVDFLGKFMGIPKSNQSALKRINLKIRPLLSSCKNMLKGIISDY